MDLFASVDLYCERLGAGLLAEPLNAISNLSFFISALLLIPLYRAHPSRPGLCLIFLIALVGGGSSLFHVFANQWSMLADVIPIGMFVFAYLWFALRRLVQLPANISYALMALFAACFYLASLSPQSLNGSLSYLPCLLALSLLAWRLRSHQAGTFLRLAALLFALSLSLRTADMAWCDIWPAGTHMFWHVLNGAVLYLLCRPLILYGKRAPN